ncbi:acetyl-CoA carboxylase biotin carboxyl carrier protein subunit [Rubrobacter xylanophilus]|uniref:Biotin carboxyl carrier protein of acetyl-CoA carboxylase n=1 Tax=Rubrobacter xylanophilus TaxID=49319 RepID=A0A510HGD4_9ACTN|nr:acetyl-CoA carboxylase biotin carboxyl carrier protein [Rubrobacter xylanophilus]BBL79020.1 acetyl-CoA carboxylase biotin carboxyl carrier protein subunit [Rubrobacter xylanophilus]
MPLSDDDVREILRIIDESDLDELRIETNGLRLYVRRGGAPPREEPEAGGDERRLIEAPKREEPPASGQEASDGRAAEGASGSDGALTIEAPMVGTFYRAEAPGARPYVEVGSRVEPDTVVCLIEVMKMMNSIRAGVSGRIAEVCVENGELVEYGQPLFRVEPDR